tara:strand:- start:295 stop:792 length:498 start_codon:yes stop_codon:yes gene_type:complete
MSSNQLSLFDQEIWRWVKGYEGYYKVSNFGRVMSKHGGKEKILKPGTNTGGYKMVILSKNGTAKNHRVHILVAKAFLPPCPGNHGVSSFDWQIDHIDGDKANNRVSNLQWLTRIENSRKSNAKLKEQNVIAIRADTRTHKEIAIEYGISASMVGYIQKRRFWKDV